MKELKEIKKWYFVFLPFMASLVFFGWGTGLLLVKDDPTIIFVFGGLLFVIFVLLALTNGTLMKKKRDITLAAIIGSFVTVSLTVYLAAIFGILGVILGFLITLGTHLAITYAFEREYFKLNLLIIAGFILLLTLTFFISIIT